MLVEIKKKIMNHSFINNKNSLFLLIFYFFAVFFGLYIFKDYGIHIEEKFHRLNGHFWLNYISQIFNFNELQFLTEKKISEIRDYTLSQVSYYNKYGSIFDISVAYIEIIFNLNNINQIYYYKHLLSYLIFLVGSFFFFKILELRYKNFYLNFLGLFLYITTPRVFGDSFLYKDTLFLSFFSITIYFFIKSIKKLNKTNLIFFSFFSAIAFSLKIFLILIPFLFFLVLIIENFHNKNSYYYFKIFLFYSFFFIFFTFIIWPYLWSDPLKNFLNLFSSVRGDLINVRILFSNEYIQNRLLPTNYLFNWIFISSPLFQNFLFFIGLSYCGARIVRRFLSVKEIMIFNDFWRSDKEQIDFIIFLVFFSYISFFIFFNAPFYNGWRLVYFLNLFIIYFAIYSLEKLLIYQKRKKKLIFFPLFIPMIVIFILNNLNSLISYHPFQSIYFNNFLNKETINGYEGDYYGLSSKHFFEKILEIDKRDKIKIAVASHTPLQRGLEAFPTDMQERFSIIGQDYRNADYIYKNNISEVNIKLNNKYEIPKNFSKIYDFKIKKLLVYEIFKSNL